MARYSTPFHNLRRLRVYDAVLDEDDTTSECNQISEKDFGSPAREEKVVAIDGKLHNMPVPEWPEKKYTTGATC
jgi:hypothetical protein